MRKKILLITALLLCATSVAFAANTVSIDVILNSVNLNVNGKRIQADNILYNGTTYVPLRAVADALGKDVGWDEATNTAGINDKGIGSAGDGFSYSNISFKKGSSMFCTIIGEMTNNNNIDYSQVSFALSMYDINGSLMSTETFYISNLKKNDTKAFEGLISDIKDPSEINTFKIKFNSGF